MLHPEDASSASNELPVRRRLLYSVRSSANSLADKVSRAVATRLRRMAAGWCRCPPSIPLCARTISASWLPCRPVRPQPAVAASAARC